VTAARGDEGRAALLFLLALALYFAAQAALRLALGGTFEGDEAEMVVLARDWHIAFGSQPPLYNWWQTLFFDLFGLDTLGLMLAKNAMLFAAYGLMFAALRPGVGVRLAMVGTLALALIPNLVWWAQRTGSHSIALAAMTAASVAAFLHLVRRPGTGAYLLFGLAVGLGGLAKPNYWLVPAALLLAGLSIASVRPVLRDRRLAFSAGLACVTVALPYGLMLADPGATFEDLWEFGRHSEATDPMRWVRGLAYVAGATAVELVPAAVVAALVLGLGGATARRRPRPGMEETLLLRAALAGLLLLVLGVIAGNVAFFRARWMLPLFMLALPPLMMMLFRNATPRATRNFLRGMACLGLVLLLGIADTRLRGAGSDSLRIDVLADEIDRQVGDVPPIMGPHYFTGNLLLHRPGWTVFPPFPTQDLADPAGRVLVVGDADTPDKVLRRLREYGYAGDALPHEELRGAAVLPYRFTEDETRIVHFAVFDFGTSGG